MALSCVAQAADDRRSTQDECQKATRLRLKRAVPRQLQRLVVRAARDFDCARISLNVDPLNIAALSLYQDLGFVEAERPFDEPKSTSLYFEHAA